MFEHFSFILSHPSHPGNIGACARAMKTMGFSKLVLINPKEYPHHVATAMASGAHDVLQNARVVSSLEQALEGCQYTIAASARHRSLDWPNLPAREMVKKVVEKLSSELMTVGILFGTESSGLSNEELRACDYHVHIPSNDAYGSLNLAQAVQVLTYELRMQLIEHQPASVVQSARADKSEMEGLYQHLEQTLNKLGILNPKQPRQLMGRLRRLFNRAELDVTEINILRGILKGVQGFQDDQQNT